VLRPRTLVYFALLLAIVAVAVASLAMRNPLKVDVIRDRGALAREVVPGQIENVYRLQLMNTDDTPRRFTVTAAGIPGIKVGGVEQPIAVGPGSTRLVALRLEAPLESPGGGEEHESARGSRHDEGSDESRHEELAPGPHQIEFTIRAVDDTEVVRYEKSSFIVPR
jgi:hypothetical protein